MAVAFSHPPSINSLDDSIRFKTYFGVFNVVICLDYCLFYTLTGFQFRALIAYFLIHSRSKSGQSQVRSGQVQVKVKSSQGCLLYTHSSLPGGQAFEYQAWSFLFSLSSLAFWCWLQSGQQQEFEFLSMVWKALRVFARAGGSWTSSLTFRRKFWMSNFHTWVQSE